jgi:O-antigen/teichoic acid export membrane protein
MGIVHRDGFKLTIVSYIGLALGYINRGLLFPKFLQTDQVGLSVVLISIALIYTQFSALGLWGIILRFFPFFRDKDKQHHGFLFWAIVLMTIGSVITTAGFIVLKPFVVKHYSVDAPLLVKYYYYIIPLGLCTVIYQVFDSYLRSLFKTVISTVISEVVLRLLTTACIILYALKVISFPQFVGFFVAINCSVGLFLVIYTAYLGQLFLKPRWSQRVRRLSKPMLVFGSISILSNAGNALITNLDTVMITTFIGTSIIAGVKFDAMAWLGIYGTIFMFTTVILIPYRSILKITHPLVAQYWKERDMLSMDKLYKQVTSVLLVLGLLFFIGIWVSMDNLLSFLPAQYKLGKYVFLFVSLGRLFDMATGLNGIITLTSKKYRYDLIFTILLIVLTVVLNYLFIRVYSLGINGAAIATMITLVAYNVLRLIFVKYFFNMHPFSINNLWVLLIACGSFLLNYFIPALDNKYIDILVRSVVITLSFMVPVLYFKVSPDVNEFTVKFLKSAGLRVRFLE